MRRVGEIAGSARIARRTGIAWIGAIGAIGAIACGSLATAFGASACGERAASHDAPPPPAPPPPAGEMPYDGPPPSPDAGAEAGLEWPNTESVAISDPWIPAHHDAITTMRPRVLAINFDDAPATRAKFHANVEAVANAMNVGSKRRGYRDASAPAFLDYHVVKWVDMADAAAPAGWAHRYSSHVRARCGRTDAFYTFDYSSLFSEDFTSAFGAPLCDLLASGAVHEIWLHMDGDPDPYVCADGSTLPSVGFAEVLESKPLWDASGHRRGAMLDPCAGNGCLGSDDAAAFAACGRTVRVLFLNSTRGPGCGLHSAGHGFETMSRQGDVPNLGDAFRHFANFDLRDRLGLPFEDWYGCSDPDCITWTGDDALTWKLGGKTGAIARYGQGCGNVHFAPNARGHYDENDIEVLSICESWDTGGAPEPFSRKKYAAYDAIAPDCGGGWQIYWRQSFARTWWPYLFY